MANKVEYIKNIRNDVYKKSEISYDFDEVKAYDYNKEVKDFVDAYKDNNEGATTREGVSAFLKDKAQDAVVVAYEEQVKSSTSFLWIKNIWVTDASYKHPVLNYTDFKAEVSREEFETEQGNESLDTIKKYTTVYEDSAYEAITGKLDVQKSQANGYFILVLLSIGTILLQQWITMRSQKEQQQFSSVDGQGASQQKMMMIIMTGMFAIFSFMYSSAFSIYMITSNVLSLVSLLVINRLVDKSLEKKAEKQFKERLDSLILLKALLLKDSEFDEVAQKKYQQAWERAFNLLEE